MISTRTDNDSSRRGIRISDDNESAVNATMIHGIQRRSRSSWVKDISKLEMCTQDQTEGAESRRRTEEADGPSQTFEWQKR